jgi:hypothetical protein
MFTHRLKSPVPTWQAFYISRARVNIAKKQFSNVNNEYEIMFENHTEIEPVSLCCWLLHMFYPVR